MQTNKIQIMDDMMRNLQRGDGISNLRALQQMRQMNQPSPVNKNIYMAKGGFPDLSGDGQITQKDILMGRGVIPKKKDPKFNGKTDNRNNRIINVQEDDKEKA